MQQTQHTHWAEYPDLLVVAVPQTRLPGVPQSTQRPAVWPAELARPVVKGPLSDETNGLCAVPARPSGVRSALAFCASTGKWYRLKGCGNNDQGFTTRVVANEHGQPVVNPATRR